MDPTDSFEAFFNSFGSFGAFDIFNAPTSPDEILEQTVGDYRALLNLVEQSIAAIDTTTLSQFLNIPEVVEGLTAEELAQLQAFAAGDFSEITGVINEARAAVAQFPDSTPMRDVFNALDPSGGSVEDIEQAIADAQTALQDALWSAEGGIFNSPLIEVDPDTGAWTVPGAGGVAYSGNTLAELYDALGTAIGNAVLSYIDTNQSLFDSLIAQGATDTSFAAAQAIAETTLSEAIATLQGFSAGITDQGASDPAAIEAQINALVEALFAGLDTALPGLAAALDGFAFGSRAEDANFLTTFDGAPAGTDEADWLILSQLGDIFQGGAAADVLFGLLGNDSIEGGLDDDNLFGGDGDDALTGGAGNDGLFGGAGLGDTAIFEGGLGQFSLRLASDGSIEVEDRTGSEGTDQLTGIETLSFGSGASLFTDGQIDLTKFQGMVGLSAEEINTFIELYIAYFNRAPDAIGLNFWGTAFATGTTLDEIAALFLDQDETRATYPSDATNLDFANQVYANVLGRVADQAGIDFWVDQLDSGNVTRGTFILEVLKGAKAEPAADADQAFIDLQLADQTYLADKTDLGTYYSVVQGLSDVADAAAAMQLFVRGDAGSAQDALDFIDQAFAAANAADSGEFIMQLVGVVDDSVA